MADSQSSPTPSGGNAEGTDLRSIATQIEGLLDDDGQFNQSGESRALNPDKYEGDRPRDESGKFKAAEQTEEVPEQAAEPEQEAVSDEQTEDAPQVEGDTDEVLADSAPDAPESDDPETAAPIRTMAEMAEALEIPLEEFKESLTHQFRAASGDVEVTLAELEKGYQRDADYRKGTQDNAEFKRQTEMEYASKLNVLEMQHQQLAAHLNATEEVIAAKLQSPQLAELRQRDAGEWNAIQTEISQELALVRQRRNEAAHQYAEFQQGQAIETKKRELDALQRAMPEFSEQHAGMARETIGSIGFAPEEVAQVTDHRLVLAALELHNLRNEVHQLRSEKETAQNTVKRVKQDIPQLQKPGKQRSVSQNTAALKRENVSKLKQRAAKSGRVEDAALVIEQMI